MAENVRQGDVDERLAVKVIVERKEESVHAHSMPTGVTFVRHSARSLAKTHVCRPRPSHGRGKRQDCGVEAHRLAENVHPAPPVCMRKEAHDGDNVSMKHSHGNIHPV